MSFTKNWKKAIQQAKFYVQGAEYNYKNTTKRLDYRRINYYLKASLFLTDLGKYQQIQSVKELARIKFLQTDKRIKAFNVLINVPVVYVQKKDFKQAFYIMFRVDREYNVKFDIKQKNMMVDLKFNGAD